MVGPYLSTYGVRRFHTRYINNQRDRERVEYQAEAQMERLRASIICSLLVVFQGTKLRQSFGEGSV